MLLFTCIWKLLQKIWDVLQVSLKKLFQDAGFTCLEFEIHERQIENRKQQVVMHRRWVQATFLYTPSNPIRLGSSPKIVQQANEHRGVSLPCLPQQQQQQHTADYPSRQANTVPHTADHSTHQANSLPRTWQHNCHKVSANASDPQQAKRCRHQPPGRVQCTMPHKDSALQNSTCCNSSTLWACHNNPSALSHVSHLGSEQPSIQLHEDPHEQQLQQALSPGQHSSGCRCSLEADSGSAELQLAATSAGSEQQQQATQAQLQHEMQAQQQEWEQGGSTPDVEQLTGCLFSEEQLEEVWSSTCACLVFAFVTTSGFCAILAFHTPCLM